MAQSTRSRSSRSVLLFAALALVLLTAGAWWLLRDDGAAAAEADRVAEGEGGPEAGLVRGGVEAPNFELETAPKAAVSGTVRDPQGKPVAGARVCVFLERDDLRGLGDGEPRCVRAGADGHYRVEDLWAVRVTVNASAPRFKPARWRRSEDDGFERTQIRLKAGETVEDIDIELEPGGVPVRGVVKDIAGGEIEGARVWAGSGRGRAQATAVAFSAGDGSFELWVAPGQTSVSAASPGYADARGIQAVAPGEFVELFLTPESVLVGRVVHADSGEPVEGVSVSVGQNFFSAAGVARSDLDGRFRIDGLEPGIYKPAAEGDDLYGQAAEQVHLGLGETSEEIVIRVHPAIFVEGRIVVADSEAPCRDGHVSLTPEGGGDWNDRRWESVDDEGRVYFRGMLPGRYQVELGCDGYLAEDSYPELELEANTRTEWQVREGLAVRGVVVDDAGEPVPDVWLSARAVVDPQAARNQVTGARERSEADGSFELAGLLPGSYEISAGSFWGGGRPGPEDPVEVELDGGADVNDLRVVMPAVAKIRGQIVDEQGEPVSGAQLLADRIDGQGRGRARSNDAGEFEIEDLQPGKFRVTAADGGSWWGGSTLRKPGTSDDDLQGEVVELAAGETAELRLVVEGQSGRITGRVVGEGGGPVADAFIDVERMSDSAGANSAGARRQVRWSWGSQPSLTDQDGRFTLEGLPEGEFIIRAHRKGGGEAVAEHVALGSEVELVIAHTGELAGTVRTAEGEAPERFTVTAYDRATGAGRNDSFFRTEGRWRFSELPAGSYTVSVTAREGTAELEDVALAEQEIREDVELTLESKLTVRGRLVDLESGEPVAGMTVNAGGGMGMGFASGPGGDGEHKNVSDADGRFELEDVPAGRVSIYAFNRAGGRDAKYQWVNLPMTLEPKPKVQDIGEIEVVPRRLEPKQEPGDLGFKLNEWDPRVLPEDYEAVVASVRPGGPAAGSGLGPGDVIAKVDGHEIKGRQALFMQLTLVPEGTVLSFETGAGETVKITVGPPV